MVNDNLKKQEQKWYLCVSRQGKKKKKKLTFIYVYAELQKLSLLTNKISMRILELRVQ